MYGSFRGIVHNQGGETSMDNSYSRWGVKGSNEVSEGLTANYRYEENLNLGTTTLADGDRLSYVGLTGGFGTVTLGRIFSAAYNHVGVLTDRGIHNAPNLGTGGRLSNALSYSASTGPVSFQVDAYMTPNSGESVDNAQFGMTVDTGFGKVGAAFGNTQNAGKKSTKMTAVGFAIPAGGVELYASWRELKNVPAVAAVPGICGRSVEDVINRGEPSEFSGQRLATRDADMDGMSCKTANTGLTKNKFRLIKEGVVGTDEIPKDRQVHYGISGSLGDSGMSYAINGADKQDDTTPWSFNVNKDLGGGASLAFEYVDYDGAAKNESLLRLKVDF